MFPHFIALFPLLSLLPSAAAHGYCTKVTIDGTSYAGNAPNAKAADSPIRQISDISPVKGANNPSMNCGLNAQLATMVVPANPGSVMDFYWGDLGGGNVSFFFRFPTCLCSFKAAPFTNFLFFSDEPFFGGFLWSQWPHNTGPLMTYMAACDTSTCDKFNGSTAKWFKIDQIGKKSDGSTWYQADVCPYHCFFFCPGPHNLSTHSEPSTDFCDASDTSSSRRLPSPERDHRAPTSSVAWRSRVLPILHANPCRRLENRHTQPNRPLSRRIQ
jgi:hypothetical protein